MVKMRQLAKKVVGAVSWQHPAVNAGLRTLDPFDWLVRAITHRRHLPNYSTRVRSNGISNQFGGRNFDLLGQLYACFLVKYASLNSESRVLEIGCGCGRTALALAKLLPDSNYVGMDIERTSLLACRTNSYFSKKQFQFDLLDVQNDLYNPEGKLTASEYKLPYPVASFNVVFLISVFTHMLPADVRNYISEIGRILTPNGCCMISTFLMDENEETEDVRERFPYSTDEYRYTNKEFPEDSIGYYGSFLREEFGRHGMLLNRSPLLGQWRRSSATSSQPQASQDFLFFSRNGARVDD